MTNYRNGSRFLKETYNPNIPAWDGDNFQLISQNSLEHLWTNVTGQAHVGNPRCAAGQLEVPGPLVKVQEETFGVDERGDLED